MIRRHVAQSAGSFVIYAALFDANAYPANMIIDTRTMRIVAVVAGVPDEAYWGKFEATIAAGNPAPPVEPAALPAAALPPAALPPAALPPAALPPVEHFTPTAP